jgi:putative membrane protein
MQVDVKALFRKQFRWKILLLRVPVNGLALIITALLVPNIYFVNRSLGSILLMAVMLGILNAIVKPVVQFLTLPFLFASYGLIVVLINALILRLLARLFPSNFAVQGLLWAIIGGAVIGLVSSFLENLFGITPPITREKHPEDVLLAPTLPTPVLPAEPEDMPVASATAVVPATDGAPGSQDATATSPVTPTSDSQEGR